MLADAARDAFLDDYPRRSVAAAEGATLTCSHTVLHPRKPTILITLPFGVPVGVARAASDRQINLPFRGSPMLQEIGAFLNAHTGTDSIEGTCYG